MFRIAHLSDLHLPPLPAPEFRQLVGKRLLGWLSWHRKRKHEHRAEVVDALLAHLRAVRPDHICITGDLTNITLHSEVESASEWLDRLGDARQVSVIPGNHDACVRGALDYASRQWARWMRNDDGGSGFPYVHYRGPVALIGLCSAVATPPGLALGRLGRAQLQHAADLLATLGKQDHRRILMLHHPPQDGACSRRRALIDRTALQRLLTRHGVDLVLHGHLHHPVRGTLRGPAGAIPVRGAGSASVRGRQQPPAHYHLIDFDQHLASPQFTIRHCAYDPQTERFAEHGIEHL